VEDSQPTYFTNLKKTTLDMVHCSTGQPGSADGKNLIHLKANGLQKKWVQHFKKKENYAYNNKIMAS
jgi:hypothetical protein